MPSGFFKKIKGGANKMGEKFLGPHYNYTDYINAPHEMGMGDKGDLPTLAKDIAGMISYGDLLVKGSGNAKKGSAPLGNRFFLSTGAKCKVWNDEKKEVPRYMYFNNSPTGAIPFLPGSAGSSFKGLLPGMVENLGAFNPMELMQGMAQMGKPPCTKMTAPVTKGGSETRYVALMDLPIVGRHKAKKLNLPSGYKFHDGGGDKAVADANSEGFQNLNDALYGNPYEIHYQKVNLREHPFANLYTAGYGFFLIYLYFQLIKRLN